MFFRLFSWLPAHSLQGATRHVRSCWMYVIKFYDYDFILASSLWRAAIRFHRFRKEVTVQRDVEIGQTLSGTLKQTSRAIITESAAKTSIKSEKEHKRTTSDHLPATYSKTVYVQNLKSLSKSREIKKSWFSAKWRGTQYCKPQKEI